jgi:hypothetical protein
MVRRPSWRLGAIVLVVLLGVTVVAALRDDDGEDEDPIPAFLDAWARSQSATFRTVADFTRESKSTGAVLTRRIVVAQRPPDRLRVDNAGATGLVDGRRVTCTYGEDEALHCDDAEARVTYEQQAERQLDTIRGYVTDDPALYTVEADLGTDDGDCFDLGLAIEMVAPPLGVRSRYCFDPETGAPTLSRVESVEAVDTVRTIQVQDEVTDADLDPERAAS